MISGIERLYREIAESMLAAIPEQFSVARYDAVFYPGGSRYEAEYERSSDGTTISFQPADGGSHAFRQLRKNFKEAGKPVWGQARFELLPDGKFKVDFGYENCDEDGNTRLDVNAEVRRRIEDRKRLLGS